MAQIGTFTRAEDGSYTGTGYPVQVITKRAAARMVNAVP
jgi:hypothetical protein